MVSRRIAAVWVVLVAIALGATRCGDVNAALEQLSHARQVSADLLVQFTKAADAANRAVMADTDEASVAYAHEAEQAKQAVQRDVDALKPMLDSLNYTDETRILQEFVSRFAAYDALDRNILDLAVENTNLKAQRLSFGPAQDAADAFRDAADALAPSVPEKDAWRARALVATAVGAVREIQALQAPHIAEPEDAAMARLEKRMSASEAAARSALDTLATIVPPGSRPKLGVARTAFDQFMKVHAEILALSHRNTNVRSLALSLTQKPALVAACDDRLRALNDALGKRGFGMSRFGK
jgi:negative regulator of replication initiation